MKIGVCSFCLGTGHWHHRGEIPKVAGRPLHCPRCHGMGNWADLYWSDFAIAMTILVVVCFASWFFGSAH